MDGGVGLPEFIIPADPSALERDEHRGLHIQNLIDLGEDDSLFDSILDELAPLASRKTAVSIYSQENFDSASALVRESQFNKFPFPRRRRVVTFLADGLDACAEYAVTIISGLKGLDREVAADEEDITRTVILPCLRNALKIWTYFTIRAMRSMFLGEYPIHAAASAADHALKAFHKVVDLPGLERAWPYDRIESQFLDLFTSAASTVFLREDLLRLPREGAHAVSAVKESLFGLMVAIIRRMGSDQSACTAFATLLADHVQTYDHAIRNTCQLLRYAFEQGTPALQLFVSTVLTQITSRAMGVDLQKKEASMIGRFFSELSVLCPGIVVAHIVIIQPALDCAHGNVRAAVLQALCVVIKNGLTPRKDAPLSAKHLKWRDQLLNLLLERVNDTSPVTRCKVLSFWSALTISRSIPLNFYQPLLEVLADRVIDKIASVRRSAMGLVVELIQYNVVGHNLERSYFDQGLKVASEKFTEAFPLGDPELEASLAQLISQTQSPSQMTQEQTQQLEQSLAQSVEAKRKLHKKLKALLKFFSYSLQFIDGVSICIEKASPLLRSKVTSDLGSVVDMIMTASRFHLVAAEPLVYATASLINSQHVGVAETVIDSFRKSWYRSADTKEAPVEHLKRVEVRIKAALRSVAVVAPDCVSSVEQLVGTVCNDAPHRTEFIKLIFDSVQNAKAPWPDRVAAARIFATLCEVQPRLAVQYQSQMLSLLSDSRSSACAEFPAQLLRALASVDPRKAQVADIQRPVVSKKTTTKSTVPLGGVANNTSTLPVNHPVVVQMMKSLVLRPVHTPGGWSLGLGGPEVQEGGWVQCSQNFLKFCTAVVEHPDLVSRMTIRKLQESVNRSLQLFKDDETNDTRAALGGSCFKLLWFSSCSALCYLAQIEDLYRDKKTHLGLAPAVAASAAAGVAASSAAKTAPAATKKKPARKAATSSSEESDSDSSSDESVDSKASKSSCDAIVGELGIASRGAREMELDDEQAEAEVAIITREIWSSVVPLMEFGAFGTSSEAVDPVLGVVFRNPINRHAAIVSLVRMMLISKELCERYVGPLFTALSSTNVCAATQQTVIVLLADLLRRYPNIITPWFDQYFFKLLIGDAASQRPLLDLRSERDILAVRATALTVGCGLVLNDVVKARSSVHYVARLTICHEPSLSSTASAFFVALHAKHPDRVYNLLPDLLSTLSVAPGAADDGQSNQPSPIPVTEFSDILQPLMKFIAKDRQCENLCARIVARFKGVRLHTARCLAVALNHMPLVTDKMIQKLNAEWKLYRHFLGDRSFYNSLNECTSRCGRKLKVVVNQEEGGEEEHPNDAPQKASLAGVTSQVAVQFMSRLKREHTSLRDNGEEYSDAEVEVPGAKENNGMMMSSSSDDDDLRPPQKSAGRGAARGGRAGRGRGGRGNQKRKVCSSSESSSSESSSSESSSEEESSDENVPPAKVASRGARGRAGGRGRGVAAKKGKRVESSSESESSSGDSESEAPAPRSRGKGRGSAAQPLKNRTNVR